MSAERRDARLSGPREAAAASGAGASDLAARAGMQVKAGSELRAAGLRECRWHGIVADDHVCVRPGEDAGMATARAFGEIRDM
jgi:hypothetical protein